MLCDILLHCSEFRYLIKFSIQSKTIKYILYLRIDIIDMAPFSSSGTAIANRLIKQKVNQFLNDR